MKKLCKIIITCIIFLAMTTSIYGTTGILPEDKFTMEKISIFVVGVFLVAQIVFFDNKKNIQQENKIIEEKQEDIDKIEIFKEPQEKVIIETVKEEIIKTKRPTLDELTKILREEQNLFSAIHTDSEIENLPDKMSPKKKNLTLKKEIFIENNKKKIIAPKGSRGEVNIVRERKKRDIKSEGKKKKRTTKTEGELKKKTIKSEGEIKKQDVKIEGKIKKKTTKKEVETKKREIKKSIDKK